VSDSASESESDQVDNAANELSPVLFGRVRKEINHIKETSSGMDLNLHPVVDILGNLY